MRELSPNQTKERFKLREQGNILKSNRWQKYLIIILVLVLCLSALPNFFGAEYQINFHPSQQVLSEKASSESQQQLALLQKNYLATFDDLNRQFSQNGLRINTANIENGIPKINVAAKNASCHGNMLDKCVSQILEQLNAKYSDEFSLSKKRQEGLPSWISKLTSEPIKLGLDLSGGVLFVLSVDLDKAQDEQLAFVSDSIKSIAREEKIRGLRLTLSANKEILLKGISSASVNKLRIKIVEKFNDLSIQNHSNTSLIIQMKAEQSQLFANKIMQQTQSTMRDRIESLGITEATVQRQGKNRIRIELPGIKSPEEAIPIIGATARLDVYGVAAKSGKYFVDSDGNKIGVKPQPIFSGSNIKDAQAGRDEMGVPLVNLILDPAGGAKMLTYSSKNVGKPLVSVYSEYYQNSQGENIKKSEVISVATIQSSLGERFSITNLDSMESAQSLATYIRAGALVAPVTIVKQRAIDATLGQSNIEKGFSALALGMGLTLLFMAVWYRRLGVIANVALTLNLLCLLGLMSLLPGAVLTLPGIAGLVLTVGMAVDTNVIIFERIKEEQKLGRSKHQALARGYENAFSTILDANVTTFITAIVLYSIGFGPVKGFAITLALGIFTSMLTGFFLSKILTEQFMSNKTQRRKRTKTEPVSAAKPESKAGSKTEPKSESKPESKPKPKSELVSGEVQ